MFVVGVAAQCQMGKDTLADRLAEKLNARHRTGLVACSLDDLGKTWERVAFAAAVKKVYCDTFGVDLAFVEKWKVIPEAPPGFDMTVRQALQFIGDGFRKIQPTVWMDIAFRDASKPRIISDVRYVNEFLRVKREGGLNILVGRADKLNDDPNGSEAQIRPYVKWALANLRGCEPVSAGMLRLAADEVPEHMDCFDLYVPNNGTKEEFYYQIDTVVVPFVEQFVFEFPSDSGEKEKTKCLISC